MIECGKADKRTTVSFSFISITDFAILIRAPSIETYSKGINESIKQGVTAFFAPDDLFGIGNAVLQNLVTFAPLTNPSGKQEADQEQSNFFIRQETTREKINQKARLLTKRSSSAGP